MAFLCPVRIRRGKKKKSKTVFIPPRRAFGFFFWGEVLPFVEHTANLHAGGYRRFDQRPRQGSVARRQPQWTGARHGTHHGQRVHRDASARRHRKGKRSVARQQNGRTPRLHAVRRRRADRKTRPG